MPEVLEANPPEKVTADLLEVQKDFLNMHLTELLGLEEAGLDLSVPRPIASNQCAFIFFPKDEDVESVASNGAREVAHLFSDLRYKDRVVVTADYRFEKGDRGWEMRDYTELGLESVQITPSNGEKEFPENGEPASATQHGVIINGKRKFFNGPETKGEKAAEKKPEDQRALQKACDILYKLLQANKRGVDVRETRAQMKSLMSVLLPEEE